MNVNVTVKGPFFSKHIQGVVKDAIVKESVEKIGERLTRKGSQGSGGRGLGVQRNTVTRRKGGMVEEIASTLHRPRVTGKSYVRKNMGIAKAMAPRVVRKTADRIITELGG